jgi:hypothetical protein
MHTLTIQIGFAFGDRVAFHSPTQGGISGIGEILAVTVYKDGMPYYIIAIPDGEMAADILEHEISLLSASKMNEIKGKGMYPLIIKSKFTFGDRVSFFSRIQCGIAGSGDIYAITIDAEGRIDYMIQLDENATRNIQPGILENEITLITASNWNQ